MARVLSTLSLSAALLASALTTQAMAQAVTLPPQADPGRIDQFMPRDARPDVSGQPLFEGLQDEKGKPLPADITFTLDSVMVEGNSVFSDDELQALYADKLGKTVSLPDLQAIADAITVKYRNAGYILSRAILPQQRIGSGEVKIQVVEGYVSGVVFDGDVPEDISQLQAYASKMEEARPLKGADLERFLLLLNDLGGLNANGILRAADSGLGASQVVVTLSEDQIDGYASVDNRGGRYLGPSQVSGGVSLHSLLGQHETISVRTLQSGDLEELSYYEMSFEAPVGALGTRARALVSYSQTEPGGNVEAFDIEGESVAATLSVTHPYIRSRQENLFLDAGFVYRNSESDTFGVNIFDDRIRTL
jgi:hemolysin activation/secretion protein